jgi:hypothetical protein
VTRSSCAARAPWHGEFRSIKHPLRASELSEQLRIWRWLHRDEVGAALVEPQALRNDDGSWTLRLDGAGGGDDLHRQVRSATAGRKPRFRSAAPQLRTRSPTAMNFWAATNLAGEPAPAAAGALQTWRTPVLPPGDWHFKVKILGDRRLGSPVAVGMSSGNAPHGSGTRVATGIDAPGVEARSTR